MHKKVWEPLLVLCNVDVSVCLFVFPQYVQAVKQASVRKHPLPFSSYLGLPCCIALCSALGYKDSPALFLVLQVYKHFLNCVKVSAGAHGVTEMGKFPWLCAKLCKCVQLSPEAGRVPYHPNRSLAGLALPHEKFLARGFRNLCAKFLLRPCCIGHIYISLPGTCPLLLKRAIVLDNFLQKVKDLPCLHCQQTLQMLFANWCVQKQKGTFWNPEKPLSPITLQLSGLVSTLS